MELKDLINSRTESLAAVAEKSGVTRQTLQNILNGKKPSLLTVKKICNYFKVDYKDYISGLNTEQ